MRAFWRLSIAELKLFLRDPAAAFFILAFPLILLWLNGSQADNEPVPEFGGMGRIDVLVPGFVALILATASLTQVPGVLATYRERGVLRRLSATPVPSGTVLGAQVVVHFLATVVAVSLVVATGTLLYDLRPPRFAGMAVAAYVIGGFALYAMGFVLAAVLPNARTATAVGFVLYFPMIFLSGAAIPREGLSSSMRQIGEALPLGPVVTALRDAWIGSGVTPVTFAVLAAMIVVGGTIGVRVFRWQ